MNKRRIPINPKACEEARHAMSASLDRELSPDASASLVCHLESCDECNEYAVELQSVHALLCEEPTDPFDVDELWGRVDLALDEEDDRRRQTSPVSNVTPLKVNSREQSSGDRSSLIGNKNAAGSKDTGLDFSRRRFLAAGVAGASVVGAGALFYSLKTRSYDVVSETVNDFLTFRASGQALHVEGGSPRDIKGWLATRVSFEIPIEPDPPSGFMLAGGRLCSFLNRRLAFFHYVIGEHAVSLYVMDQDGLKVPDSKTRRIGNRRVSATSLKGVTNVLWRNEGLIYVAVSDLTEDEVFRFVENI